MIGHGFPKLDFSLIDYPEITTFKFDVLPAFGS